MWAKGFPDGATAGDGDDFIDGIASLSSGDIAIAGHYTGSVSLGNQVTLDPMNDVPFFWAKLDSQGVAQWANPGADEVDVDFIGVENNSSDGMFVGCFTQGLDYSYSIRISPPTTPRAPPFLALIRGNLLPSSSAPIRADR